MILSRTLDLLLPTKPACCTKRAALSLQQLLCSLVLAV
jgi:hypothetical protein